MAQQRVRTRWPKGAWMRLQSPETLAALMRQRDIGLGRLARYVGCSKGFMSHLTSGRRSTCAPVTATRIAEALDVPLEILFVPSVPVADRRPAKQKVPA